MSQKPTPEQQAYIDCASDQKNKAVDAKAGTGKTTTACLLGDAYPNKIFKIAVFASKNAKEMQEKLPSNMEGTTFHSMCGKWIKGRRPVLLDGSGVRSAHAKKVPQIILETIPDYDYRKVDRSDPMNATLYDNVTSLADIVDKMKNTYPDAAPTTKEVIELAEYHQIEYVDNPEIFANYAIKVLELSDYDRKSMDFSDMLRFPYLDNSLQPNCDIFIGDEVQDSTPIRIAIMKKIAKMGVTVHGLGDEDQGIFVFTGASLDSFKDFVKEIDATIMPLTVNFRCSKAVIREAQKIVPDIKYWDGAPEGEVKVINPEDFGKMMQPGDCAIARYNKIIIPAVFKLLRQGKKATIQGADFGKQIVKIIKGVKAQDMADFNHKLANLEERAYSKCSTELGKTIVEDKFATIGYFADNSKTVQEMITMVESLFSDKTISPYVFSTAHKAKGLEWNNVFILDHQNFKATQATQPWQLTTERRLEYVAKTRAKMNMYYS